MVCDAHAYLNIYRTLCSATALCICAVPWQHETLPRCEYAQRGAILDSSAHTLQYTSLPVYTRDAKPPAPATAQRVYTRTTDNTDNTRVYTHTPGWQENKHTRTDTVTNTKRAHRQLTGTTHRCTAHPQTARDSAGHSTAHRHTHMHSAMHSATHSTAYTTLYRQTDSTAHYTYCGAYTQHSIHAVFHAFNTV